ncbi:AT-rich interactive domain-containing protein 2 [Linum grandiflorum]
MAGWSMFANGTGLDSAAVDHKQKGILDAVKDIDVVNGCDDDYVELRRLFDQALSVFKTVEDGNKSIDPVPAAFDNGETVDLFKLFCVVGERGGFDLVDGYWNSVTEELGWNPQLSDCVKVVYSRYLYDMERWLADSCRDKEIGHSDRGHCSRNIVTFSLDLGTKLRSLLADGKMGKNLGLDAGESRLGMLGTQNTCRTLNGFRIRNDDDENVAGGYGNHGDNAADPNKSRKRKRESISKMLSWVRQAAARPKDRAVFSMSYDREGNDLKALAISSRNFLVHKTHGDSKDIDAALGVEKLRCTKRQLALQQSHRRSRYVRNAEDIKNRTTKTLVGLKDERIRVRVNARYQVRVPKWTGEVYESDDKWLGTKIWPMQEDADTGRAMVVKNHIGKGRPDFCKCKIPGSVLCVGFHIAESRMKLKVELGRAFFRNGFNVMGEEVSLRWTAEEERSFMKMVRLNRPSLEKNFWDYAHAFLPGKTRRELVSYYFNVFQLQRRSFQNRVTPDDIDSEDDEKPFESFTYGFGIHRIEVGNRDAEEEVCAMNEQCTDYPNGKITLI